MTVTALSARCPLCARHTAAFHHHGRLIYVQHYTADRDVCEASGWLVEDEEVTS